MTKQVSFIDHILFKCHKLNNISPFFLGEMSFPVEVVEEYISKYVWPAEYWKLPLIWRGVSLYNIFNGYWMEDRCLWSTVIHIDDRVAYFKADLFWNIQPLSLYNKNYYKHSWGDQDDIDYLALWFYYSRCFYNLIDVTYIEGGNKLNPYFNYWIVENMTLYFE